MAGGTTDLELKRAEREEEIKDERELRTKNKSDLLIVIEEGRKTSEMIKTEGWLVWKEKMLYQIDDCNAKMENIDPAKNPTKVTRYLERKATLREFITKIEIAVEKGKKALELYQQIEKQEKE